MTIDRLARIHARLDQDLAALKLHLSVARLTAHGHSLEEDGLAEVANEYDAAQRFIEAAASSLERARTVRHVSLAATLRV